MCRSALEQGLLKRRLGKCGSMVNIKAAIVLGGSGQMNPYCNLLVWLCHAFAIQQHLPQAAGIDLLSWLGPI